ncbi:hypothetical protein [Paenibacillus sp. PAMC21692]|uniref:TolB family protein n=1 Tax=Paenibacillus sp. PAMC21692 TaxID=2762320 RepID=UPI001C9A6372|nr:hypothetical protein [Paenibacillus sp. PAMC21692]
MIAVPHHFDQGWIAYTSDRNGTFDIWLYRPQSGLHFQLTRGLGAEHSVPYWSPDNRRMVRWRRASDPALDRRYPASDASERSQWRPDYRPAMVYSRHQKTVS